MEETNSMEVMRTLVQESLEAAIPDPVRRDIDPHVLQKHNVFSVIGPRRAGKTWFLYQWMRDLLAAGVPRGNLLYLNFEDERLYPLRGGEITALWDVFRESPGLAENKPIWCFLDEVQNIPYWSKWVRRVTDQDPRVHVAVTGSSSTLLGSEIATELRGRGRTITIYPYSFREFLRAHGEDPDNTGTLLRGAKRHKTSRHAREYFERGGFPGVFGQKDPRPILQEYYRTMFTRDMIERFRIGNVRLFADYLKLQLTRFAALSSISNIVKDMRSLGHDCGKSTLNAYLGYAKDVFLLFEAPIFSPKVKNQMLYPRKVYGVDHGLLQAIRFSFSQDRGRLLENMVFVELVRRNLEVFYSSGQGECDFVARQDGRVAHIIQVCLSLENRQTFDRERRGLLEAMETFKVKEGTIVTENDSGEMREGKNKIVWMPFRQFALNL
jgi:predicted AAA+ superfamily ATPase